MYIERTWWRLLFQKCVVRTKFVPFFLCTSIWLCHHSAQASNNKNKIQNHSENKHDVNIPLMLLVLFVTFCRSEIPLVATIDHIMLTEIKACILKKYRLEGTVQRITIRLWRCLIPINQLSKMPVIDGPIVYDAHAQLSLF